MKGCTTLENQQTFIVPTEVRLSVASPMFTGRFKLIYTLTGFSDVFLLVSKSNFHTKLDESDTAFNPPVIW